VPFASVNIVRFAELKVPLKIKWLGGMSSISGEGRASGTSRDSRFRGVSFLVSARIAVLAAFPFGTLTASVCQSP
jgi:hypothetical protein